MKKEYNDKGQLISKTYQVGKTYRYAYDERGNEISTTLPNGNKITY